MERLSRVACYFRWMKNASPRDENEVTVEDDGKTVEVEQYRNVGCNIEASRRLCSILESILLWENSVNSISVVIVFNILFWGSVVLEVRGFAAASSAALVIVLCYTTFEAQLQKEIKASDPATFYAKTEYIEKAGARVKSAIHSLKQLRRDQPRVFCTAVCSLSLGLWIIGRTINGVIFAYMICMSILLGPALLLKLPSKMILHKEWDSEIEEFLPAVTEDNLQVLTRAGESGDQSPTPTSVISDAQNEFFNDEDLVGLKMPSHEEGSIDGVEVSELELSAEETDVDGIKFQSGHFEKGSSSEEEAELEPISRKLISHSDESGSEFEIIDSQEIDELNIA
ncbi:reticulophagy regulator 3-like isoform X1 [Colletes gigas]|uniref:reticulophagy regulator 3-like isoform X1 n=1 Tax=Colletes gigas TaxID=935657 RepID=UPI001C9B7CD6|nr:reticulophagy regulator 3-like isoform X1 [Colletes gigas]